MSLEKYNPFGDDVVDGQWGFLDLLLECFAKAADLAEANASYVEVALKTHKHHFNIRYTPKLNVYLNRGDGTGMSEMRDQSARARMLKNLTVRAKNCAIEGQLRVTITLAYAPGSPEIGNVPDVNRRFVGGRPVSEYMYDFIALSRGTPFDGIEQFYEWYKPVRVAPLTFEPEPGGEAERDREKFDGQVFEKKSDDATRDILCQYIARFTIFHESNMSDGEVGPEVYQRAMLGLMRFLKRRFGLDHNLDPWDNPLSMLAHTMQVARDEGNWFFLKISNYHIPLGGQAWFTMDSDTASPPPMVGPRPFATQEVDAYYDGAQKRTLEDYDDLRKLREKFAHQNFMVRDYIESNAMRDEVFRSRLVSARGDEHDLTLPS